MTAYLRRALLAATVVALLMAATVVLVLRQADGAWRLDLGWAWLNWSSQLQVVGPLAGALAAGLVSDALRQGRRYWLSSGRRGAALLRALVLVSLAPGVVILGMSGGWVAVESGVDSRWAVASVVNALSVLVICTGLGALAGRIWPHLATPGVVIVALWGLLVGANALPFIGDWLGVDGASSPLAGYRPAPGLAWERLLTAALVTVVSLVAMEPLESRTWPPRRAALTGGVSAAIVLLLVVPGWFDDVSDASSDPKARAGACVEGRPSVCVLPEHEAMAAAVQSGLAKFDVGLVELGLDVPKQYVETTPWEFFRRQTAAGHLPVDERGGRVMLSVVDDPAFAALSTLDPPECVDAVSDEPTLQAVAEAREVVMRWAVQQLGAETATSPTTKRFDRLSPDDQEAWLRYAVVSLRSCDYASTPTL